MFIRFFVDEKIERVISLHEQAFQELEAVPQTITYDNMTTVGRHIGPGKVWINPVFQSFANGYGFKVIILPPGKKERHGIVERPFYYIETNFLYSVDPALIGQWVKLRLYKDRLEIWFEEHLHCKHTYAQGRNQRQILPEHEKEYKKTSGQKQLLESAFLRFGESARAYYQGLQEEKKVAAGYHLQRILKLANRYGQDVVSGALNYAARYGAYSADAVL